MIKLLGSNNDLMDKYGKITKCGYIVMAISTVFGIICFLIGRSLYGKAIANNSEKKS